jgi:hypothetical protein
MWENLMPKSEVQIKLDDITLNCTLKEITATFSWLLTEMRAATPRLRPDEREVLRHIMAHESGSLTVGEVFPDFTRESEGHKTLRRLRAAQFIRPAITGRWEPGERIEVKPFGLLIWKHSGEVGLFSDANGHGHASGGDNETDDVVIDLASPSLYQMEQKEPAPLQDEDVAEGNDDLLEVLDFSRDKMDGHI